MKTVSPVTVTPEAARRLAEEADFTRAMLRVRHMVGCGGSGFRISVEEGPPEDGRRFESAGIPIVMDDYAAETLDGAVLDVDPDPAGHGYRLDHANAVLATTFC